MAQSPATDDSTRARMTEHFFITGGSGLLGLHLVGSVLRFFPNARITLLLRAQSDADCRKRLMILSRRLERVLNTPEAGLRLSGVCGDVTLERFGLRDGVLEELRTSVSHVVHGAATIRFDHPIDEARAINYAGTRRMLDLAQRWREGGRLERFFYLGTSSVSGQRSGRIYEHELEMGQRFFNTYEQSKCESERLVRDHFDRFPCTVFRPSIVIGDSRNGYTSTFNVIYIPLRLLHMGMLSIVPGEPGTTIDLVPVDWVADAMAFIMTKAESVGEVFHITAGAPRAATLGELVERATRYFDVHAPLARPRQVSFVTREDYEERRQLSRGRELSLLTQLDALLPYVSINRLFDTTGADRLLEGSGILFPFFREYADRIFDYCIRTQWGRTSR